MERPSIITRSSSLPDLPADLFGLIIEHLEAWDLVRCQMVSAAWFKAFSAPDFLRIVIKKYPNAREARELISPGILNTSARDTGLEWRSTFNRIACRYYHLIHGRPRRIERYKTAIDERVQQDHWFPVRCWDYHESQPRGRLYHLHPSESIENHERLPADQPYLFRHAFWSYDDGLLIFVPADPLAFDRDTAEAFVLGDPIHSPIMMLDLESRRSIEIPFDIKDRVVRNLRLKERTLVIEWAEREPYHALNDSDYVHRHFTTCYDIEIEPTLDGVPACSWTVTLRSEWKLHFLGLPLNQKDRFFSTHTKDHYAVYLWQPNRSMYTGDEEQPIECLLIWDIAQPRKYLPSLDPGGKDQPFDIRDGPHIVSRFNYRLLDHYGIRQQDSPSLMKISLDSQSCSITFRENACVAGQGYFDPAERLWYARTTKFLFCAEGPYLQQELDGKLPPYRGNCSLETDDLLDSESWFLGIMDVVDEKANVRFSLVESVFTGKDVSNTAFVRIRASDRMATLDAATTKQIAHMGKIAGDERFLVGQNDNQEIVVLRFD